MEEKRVKKISISTFFLILAIIVIIVMGVFIYKLNNDKLIEIQKATELQSKVNSLNETVNKLQKKIDKVSETINSNDLDENTTANNINNNNSTSFKDEQVETALANYLELKAHAGCDILLENLKEKGKLDYDSSKDNILNDSMVVTSIKFSDYKNAMLNYVSESAFEKNWTSSLHFKENSNGYLTKVQGGGGLCVYTVNSITKIDNSTYSAKTTATLVDLDNSKEDENFTFTVTSYKNNCVIDSINK